MRLPAGDRGASIVAMSGGVLVFLTLLLAAVQILYGLYATSLVTAAAHEAAHDVASVDHSADRCAAVGPAEARLRDSLGDYADAARLTLEWTCSDPAAVRLRVRATHPGLLPRQLAGITPLAELDRTITVRLEAPR